jgi:integrase
VQSGKSHARVSTPEDERIIAAARRAGGRLADRDALLIKMAYRHGFRASELIALRFTIIERLV